MSIPAIPRWPWTPTLSATRGFLFFRLLAARHNRVFCVSPPPQDGEWGSLRPLRLLTLLSQVSNGLAKPLWLENEPG